MQKKYFTKYLPVEDNIKVGDTYLSTTKGFSNRRTGKPLRNPYWVTKVKALEEHGFEVEHLNGKSAGYIPYEGNKCSKLYLCSREIQIEDEVYMGSEKYKVNNEEDLHEFSKGGFKVLGEISPDAIWVKEDDEFIIDQLEHVTRHNGIDCNFFRILCPTCQTYH